MTERRRRLRLKIAEAEFKRTGNALYAWDGLYAVLQGGQRRVTIPDWIRNYLMDSIVGLNHLTFGVVDRKLRAPNHEEEEHEEVGLTPSEAEGLMLDALKLRKGKRKGAGFAEYVQGFTDAPLMADHRGAVKDGEKIEAWVYGPEERYEISRRTVFNRLRRQRDREERHTKLARKHKLLPGD